MLNIYIAKLDEAKQDILAFIDTDGLDLAHLESALALIESVQESLRENV